MSTEAEAQPVDGATIPRVKSQDERIADGVIFLTNPKPEEKLTDSDRDECVKNAVFSLKYEGTKTPRIIKKITTINKDYFINPFTPDEIKQHIDTAITEYDAEIDRIKRENDKAAERKKANADYRRAEKQIAAASLQFGDIPEDLIIHHRCSDGGNADRFLNKYGFIVKYCTLLKTWYIWNGKIWEPDQAERRIKLAEDVVRDIYREAAEEADSVNRTMLVEHGKRSEDIGRKKAMLELARPHVSIRPDDIDNKPYLFNVQNGTIELHVIENGEKKWKYREFRKEDNLSEMSNFTYDPKATYTKWLKHLDLVFRRRDWSQDHDEDDKPSREGMAKAYKERMGYSLIGGNPEAMLVIMYGPVGQNGKSVTNHVMLKGYGDYGISIDKSTVAKKKDGNEIKARSDLVRLKNKRFAIISELEDNQTELDLSFIKAATGGEMIVARGNYEKEEISFNPWFTPFLQTNHKPKIKDDSHSAWRRIHLLEFEYTIKQDEARDRDEIIAELCEEFPGILNWLLDGLQEYYDSGSLYSCERMNLAKEEYRGQQSLFRLFINDHFDLVKDFKVSLQDAYKLYTKFCDDRKLSGKDKIGERKFVEKIEEMEPSVYGKKGRERMEIYGLKLKDGKTIPVDENQAQIGQSDENKDQSPPTNENKQGMNLEFINWDQ